MKPEPEQVPGSVYVDVDGIAVERVVEYLPAASLCVEYLAAAS